MGIIGIQIHIQIQFILYNSNKIIPTINGESAQKQSLTLLLVGGGESPPPPVVFLICTKNRLR